MNREFDELAKSLAQSVTRRGALKKFGVGLAAIALATLGFSTSAEARGCKGTGKRCHHAYECCSRDCVSDFGRPGFCN
jgi:hypothetical protein